MTLFFTQQPPLLIATVGGRLDSVTAVEAQTSFDEKLKEHNGHLILNLSSLDYLSSAGLRALLTAIKRVSARNGKCAMVVTQAHIQEILQISGLLTLVPSYPSLEEAKAALLN